MASWCTAVFIISSSSTIRVRTSGARCTGGTPSPRTSSSGRSGRPPWHRTRPGRSSRVPSPSTKLVRRDSGRGRLSPSSRTTAQTASLRRSRDRRTAAGPGASTLPIPFSGHRRGSVISGILACFRWEGAGDGHWVMALACRSEIRFFTSADLISWVPVSTFTPAAPAEGVLETPDLIPVDHANGSREWVLSYGVLGAGPCGGSGTRYMVGTFDGISFRPGSSTDSPAEWADLGPTSTPPKPGRAAPGRLGLAG